MNLFVISSSDFLGIAPGSWMQWIFGILFTLINLQITTIRYRREHSVRIIFRITHMISKNDGKGGTSVMEGLQISAMNVGIPTNFSFIGLTRHYYKHKWKINNFILNHLYFLPKRLINDIKALPDGIDERVMDLSDGDIDFLFTGQVKFEPLKNIDDSYVVAFTKKELSKSIIKLCKREKFLTKRIIKHKRITFDANFTTFDGIVEKVKFVLDSADPLYVEISQSLTK